MKEEDAGRVQSLYSKRGEMRMLEGACGLRDESLKMLEGVRACILRGER